MKRKTTIKEETQSAIAFARKHWIVYIIPVLFLGAGFYFLAQTEITGRILGLLLAITAILRIVQVTTVKWYLTQDVLIVREGWPWAKKYHSIPVFDLYQSTAAPGKFSRLFDTSTLSAKGRELPRSVQHINITDAKSFCEQVDKVVKKSPAHSLNNAFALKEKGALSEAEYELMKLGVITQKYLG